jgi:hypothetical protein
MAAQPRNLRRVRAFLDSLLGRSPLDVELHYRPPIRLQVRDDESQAREKLPKMELHLRYHPLRRLPTGDNLKHYPMKELSLYPLT